MGYIKKLVDAIKLYKTGIFSIAINRYFRSIFSYQNFFIYSYNLHDNIKVSEQDFSIEKLTKPQGSLFRKFRRKFPAGEFISRLNQRDRECYLAVQNGEIAGYGWIAFNELLIDSINYRYELKDDEFFIYSCFVPKDFRGKGIYPAMLQKMLKDGSEAGKKRALIGVLSGNTGSIKGIEKAGFNRIENLRYLKILNNERWQCNEKNKAKALPAAAV